MHVDRARGAGFGGASTILIPEDLVTTQKHSFLVAATFVLVAAASAASAAAQQFSADIVNTPKRGSETSRLYVGSNDLKLQSLQNGQPSSAAIWDFNTKALTLLIDSQHAYIGGTSTSLVSQMMAKSGAPPIWRLFRPSPNADPCTTWNALIVASTPRDSTPAGHVTCRSAGDDAVGGRPAQKWDVTSTDRHGKVSHGMVWIDSRLHVVSKSQDSTGTMELANVQEGPQPASVFAIPAGYHPLDLNKMMTNAFASESSLANALAGAAKQVGNDAANSTTDAAKAKASTSVSKKLKGILRLP